MAKMIIRLEVNPTNGRKDIWIDYHSDADALPMEHEEEHSAIVEKLISGGVVAQQELGRVVVRRATEVAAPVAEPVEPVTQAEALKR